MVSEVTKVSVRRMKFVLKYPTSVAALYYPACVVIDVSFIFNFGTRWNEIITFYWIYLSIDSLKCVWHYQLTLVYSFFTNMIDILVMSMSTSLLRKEVAWVHQQRRIVKNLARRLSRVTLVHSTWLTLCSQEIQWYSKTFCLDKYDSRAGIHCGWMFSGQLSYILYTSYICLAQHAGILDAECSACMPCKCDSILTKWFHILDGSILICLQGLYAWLCHGVILCVTAE